MLFIIISVAIQMALAIHVLRTNRKPAWVLIISFVPILGCLAYIFVELMPGWLDSRSGQPGQKKIRYSKDSDKALKEAIADVELADTPRNRMKLAEHYLIREQFQEAKEQYQKCLVGINKTDPALMLGLASADFGLTHYAQTIETLEALKLANPDFKSPPGHLIYARAQEHIGNIDAASNEYEALIQYYPSPEPTCRFALLLKNHGDIARAQELFMKVVDYSENAGRQYNYVHEEWVTMAKREARS
ncbi:PLDc N-terminal domain-containing protein [Crenothrix sp.]|uniref:PLDc N-terminal domain-containing protein n=1 Tax=Crenothrix sp. TaxID=3100433 RepID=UPI00374DE416